MSDLRYIHAWDAHMDVVKIRAFALPCVIFFFTNYDLGKQLSGGKTKEFAEFRLH